MVRLRSRFNRWNNSITSTEVRVSNAPVGSSAKMMEGLFTKARANATQRVNFDIAHVVRLVNLFEMNDILGSLARGLAAYCFNATAHISFHGRDHRPRLLHDRSRQRTAPELRHRVLEHPVCYRR